MNTCKGVCQLKLTTANYTRGWSYLGVGWRKCGTCMISIKTDEFKCPCCKRKLRVGCIIAN